jgi:hypothetical protein
MGLRRLCRWHELDGLRDRPPIVLRALIHGRAHKGGSAATRARDTTRWKDRVLGEAESRMEPLRARSASPEETIGIGCLSCARTAGYDAACMKLSEMDETMTAVPIDAATAAVADGEVLAVLPANEQEHGTATLLIAKQGKLWIVSRAYGSDPHDAPGVATDSIEWHEVGIGPFGVSGRVPGGYLGGAVASDHLLTVVAGDHIYQARLHGERGSEAVESFASVAFHVGASDWEPS